jgi:hypothetical protein
MSTHTITVTKSTINDGSLSATVNVVVRGVGLFMTALAIAREYGAPEHADVNRQDTKNGYYHVVSWTAIKLVKPEPDSTEKTFDEALAEFCEKTRQAHQEQWDEGAMHLARSGTVIGGNGMQNTKGIECMHGKKYVRIVSTETISSSRSAICFIDKKTGDIWKAASWKAPAKNFPRGNIFKLENHRFPPHGY